MRQQLAVGGRLVMPVGLEHGGQRLTKLTRYGETEFEVEDLGAVNFVPLIGEHGWTEEGGRRRSRQPDVPRMIAEAAEPLPDIDDPAFGRLFDRFADRRVVLLGESSHGTSEFYRARAAITRRLVEAHGFTIVAVEADWPDAAAIDRHVQHRPAAARSEPPFQRFPTWMWRNVEVEGFVHWLRSHNAGRSPAQRAGFYGLGPQHAREGVPDTYPFGL